MQVIKFHQIVLPKIKFTLGVNVNMHVRAFSPLLDVSKCNYLNYLTIILFSATTVSREPNSSRGRIERVVMLQTILLCNPAKCVGQIIPFDWWMQKDQDNVSFASLKQSHLVFLTLFRLF